MSKAFTKESDGDEEEEWGAPAIPSGAKNYITPQGYARLKAELLDLIDTERPKIVDTLMATQIPPPMATSNSPT